MSITSWQGTMPNTATQVAELQNSTLALSKKGVMSNLLFQDTIYRIMALRDQVKAAESRFYKSFNLPEGSEGLRILQQRIDTLNGDPGFRSMSNLDDSYFNQLVASAINKIDLTEPVTVFFQDEQIQRDFLSSEFGQNTTNGITNLLIEAINRSGTTKATGAGRVNKSSSGNYGLSQYIGEVIINPEKGKNGGIKIKFEKSLPQSWQNRLQKDYGLIFDNSQISKEKILENWLRSNITNPTIKNHVMYQFKSKINSYDLNNSTSSIKGFLGEVRTAAFLDYLCGRNGSAIPTGNVHQIINGHLGGEVAIDILLRGFGFQVKNYQITKSGQTTFMHRDSMGMGNFIVERMRPESGISELLQKFFGSWAFNQPVEDATENYQQIYRRFSNNNLSQVFDGYIDNILKISDEFQANIKAFANRALYFNTFFVIGDKFVPSSAMLTAIIQSLQLTSTDKIAQSSFVVNSPSSEGEIWQQDKPYSNTSALELANRVKISWYITLDLNRILEIAYNQIF